MKIAKFIFILPKITHYKFASWDFTICIRVTPSVLRFSNQISKNSPLQKKVPLTGKTQIYFDMYLEGKCEGTAKTQRNLAQRLEARGNS